MENSVVLLLRNFVMLACLLVVPLLALLGPSVTGFRSPRLVAAESNASRPRPKQGDLGRQRVGGEAMGVPNLPASMFAGGEPGLRPMTAPLKHSADMAPGVLEQGAIRPAIAQIAKEHAVQVAPANFSAAASSKREISATGDAHLPRSERVAWPPAGPGALAKGRSQQDYLETLTTRLRELGAGYYLLECWGQQQKVYRFYCQMGEGGAQVASFEAVAPDQVSAVERVLDKAEAWSASRLRAGGTAERPRGPLR